ncbi:MAG: hypothetical protein Q9207_008337 [Kuettlingeria erythrocarpa]
MTTRSVMAPRYEYSPLRKNAGQIRLLTLLPDQFGAPIRINIRIKRLAKKTRFEALSYAWGSASDPQEIYVEAKEPKTWRLWHPTSVTSKRLPVTQNLYGALQHLRLRDRPRVFWIDAICVDQQNLKERGTQVLRMPDIYTQAKRVVVWLGPESYNSTLAMKAIDDIGSRIAVDWYLKTIKTTSKDGSDPNLRELGHDLRQHPDLWLAFKDLLNRPYFRRLWVVQEIYLAKERAQIRLTHRKSAYHGRLGLAPKATEPGDKICVLLGCESPLVLRSDGSGNHAVVGECYIDGMMSGEALLGKLPKKWTVACKYFHELHNNHNVLIDSTTDQTTPQDPRLGPLPAGWKLENHMEMHAYNWYYNKRTGEDTQFDPRLEPDALRERGVELQEFHLV